MNYMKRVNVLMYFNIAGRILSSVFSPRSERFIIVSSDGTKRIFVCKQLRLFTEQASQLKNTSSGIPIHFPIR